MHLRFRITPILVHRLINNMLDSQFPKAKLYLTSPMKSVGRTSFTCWGLLCAPNGASRSRGYRNDRSYPQEILNCIRKLRMSISFMSVWDSLWGWWGPEKTSSRNMLKRELEGALIWSGTVEADGSEEDGTGCHPHCRWCSPPRHWSALCTLSSMSSPWTLRHEHRSEHHLQGLAVMLLAGARTRFWLLVLK